VASHCQRRTVRRYAVTLYEKFGGEGIRTYLDPSKLDEWPAVKEWFFKLTPKKSQDSKALFEQIRDAGTNLYSMQDVRVRPRFLEKRSKGGIALCPLCGEAYPSKDGAICRACGDEKLYTHIASCPDSNPDMPEIPVMPVEESIGHEILHDMTRIVPKREKGPAFRQGHVVTADDINLLLQMGKKQLYVGGTSLQKKEWVHEDEAALAFARVMAGEGVSFTDRPSEGKVTFSAERDGLLVVDEDRLFSFNMLSHVMCASRQSCSVVSRDDKLAGTRAIPLYLSRDIFNKAMAAINGISLFTVLHMRQARVGILVTGTEIFEGRVEDRFVPLLRRKLKN
jgi:Formylmethanofuran dehydrogenase subunit E